MLYSLVVHLNNGIERVTVYQTTNSKRIEVLMVAFLGYFKAGLSPGWHSISTLSHDLGHSCICTWKNAVATGSC